MRHVLTALALLAIPVSATAQDVFFLGETHDNPGHHQRQSDRVSAINPSALVFEMLTPKQAQAATPQVRRDRNLLETSLGWAESGWPDFAMYAPIFEAAPDAAIFGAAVPRDQARRIMKEPLADIFVGDAKTFGLDDPLPPDQQAQREVLQQEAHCNALPETMLPMMVSMQRLRDAALAKAVVDAMAETGGPVAVITGNGHARKDWGAPAVLAYVAPDLVVFSLGQGEDGHEMQDGTFDEIAFSPAVEREDPCAAFQ